MDLKEVRKLILNTKEPLLVQNRINSNLISWTLNYWKEVLNNKKLEFRCGKNYRTRHPQWEYTCSKKVGTFQDFLDHVESDSNEWWYFDYKYLCEWLTDAQILRENICWTDLGFPELSANDSTIWIGSKGAHTCCHMDTYGCNLVLQLFGRKQWVLFPPEENLKPTRIPYEESSIYSKLNFFSPNEYELKDLSHGRSVILNPGDVLVLPHKWWHYVENLETAISVNVWIPLPQDNLERVKESIAVIFVRGIAKALDANLQSIVLNPNITTDMVNCNEAIKIISALLNSGKDGNKIQKVDQLVENPQKIEDLHFLLSKFDFISKIPELDRNELKLFLQSQSKRFSVEEYNENETVMNNEAVNLLEAITDDEVLSLITKKMLERR